MRLRPVRLFLPCGLALLTFAAPRLPADDRPTPPDVFQLVERLGSNDFAERDSAARELERVGAPALAALRQAAAGQDPEARRRATELVRRVERRALAARLLEAKRVRLVFQDTPVPEAVAEFARRTGFTIQLEGDTTRLAQRRLTLDTGPVPFWEAFDQFCHRAGVAEPDFLADGQKRRGASAAANNPYGPGMAFPSGGYAYYNPYAVDGNHGRLALVEGQAPGLPTCAVGAVRVRALPPHVSLPLVLLGSEERLLGLQVTAEPDVAWQGVIALHVTRAVDERGRQLPPSLPFLGSPTGTPDQQAGFVRVWDPNGYPVQAQAVDARNIPVRLRVGPSGTKVLKEVAGVITAQVQTPPETLLSVEDVPRAVGQAVRGPHGGWLKVLGITRDPTGVVKLHGQIAYPPSEEALPAWMQNAFDPRMGRVMFFVGAAGNQQGEVPNLELRDNRGLPFQRQEQPQGQAPDLTDPRPHDFHLTFQPRPGQTEPAQLVYVGRRTLIVDFPFALKDVTVR
jgi:hypothetical protein